MPGQPTPPLIVEAFAKNAAAPYIQNPIPLSTGDPARASFDLGFPPQTMTEIFAGGTPPYGQDVNGILFMLSSHIAAQQAGQPYKYSSALSTAMGGYAAGTVLGMADNTGLWLNSTAGNTSDPDGGSPVNWYPVYARGFTSFDDLTGGVRVLTATEAKRKFIIFGGALTSNAQLIFPSGAVGERGWTLINSTSGAFTVTAKTAAGTGVVIPQGGPQAPTNVYGDGVNIYNRVAPLSIPIDQNPTPSSIAQRTNNGYLFATYFNSNNAIDNFGMAAVYADAGDGYHRKISPADFAAQISLAQFAGSVVNAQVPLSAVMQYIANILANAALTGVPTAPTAGVGTNTTQVATTQFVMSQALGNAQAWSNPARAFNTTYTNATGRAIQVNVGCGFQPGGNSATLVVDGVGVAVGGSGGSAASSSTLTATVGPGGTYRVNTGGSVILNVWAELS